MKATGRALRLLAVTATVLAGCQPPHTNLPAMPSPPPTTGTAPGQPTLPPPASDSTPTALSPEYVPQLLGSVQSDSQATLSTRQPARIAAVFFREGDAIRRGAPLIQLDDTEARTQERTAQAGVTAAQAQLQKARTGRDAQRIKADAEVTTARDGQRTAEQKLQQATLARDSVRANVDSERKTAQEGVRKAEIALDTARKTLHSLEELDKIGGVSRNDLEGARTQVQVAQSDLDSARSQAKSLEAGPDGVPYRIALAQKDVDAAQEGVRQAQEGVRQAQAARKQTLALAAQDIRAAQAALTQANVGVSGAQAALRSLRLTSPLDGIATASNAHAGETAQPGAPLVTIVSLSHLRVDALVPARLIGHLAVGQAATITLDTAPGKTFSARVGEIARVAEPDGRTFRVKFPLLRPAALRPGQTAHIRVRSQ